MAIDARVRASLLLGWISAVPLAGGALAGCASADPCEDASYFATTVVTSAFGPGQAFGREHLPEIVLGPPAGGGASAGSLDVASLGNGGSITLGFDRAIVDGAGADFVVFENPFEAAGALFAELATVAVSADGATFHEFDCTASEPPYGGCAGWRPVFLAGDDRAVDVNTAGGDAFDLAHVGLKEARFVRITDRPDLEGLDGVFDLDAVGIVHDACP